MKLQIIAASLVLGAAAFAQSAPTQCPAQLDKANLQRQGFGATGIHFRETNISQKQIVGTKVGALTVDAVGDKHSYPIDATSTSKLKPGQTDKNLWFPLMHISAEPARGVEVYVEKVLFADGTTWQDDGSHSCNAVSVK